MAITANRRPDLALTQSSFMPSHVRFRNSGRVRRPLIKPRQQSISPLTHAHQVPQADFATRLAAMSSTVRRPLTALSRDSAEMTATLRRFLRARDCVSRACQKYRDGRFPRDEKSFLLTQYRSRNQATTLDRTHPGFRLSSVTPTFVSDSVSFPTGASHRAPAYSTIVPHRARKAVTRVNMSYTRPREKLRLQVRRSQNCTQTETGETLEPKPQIGVVLNLRIISAGGLASAGDLTLLGRQCVSVGRSCIRQRTRREGY